MVQGPWDDPLIFPDPESLIRRSPGAAPLLDAVKDRKTRDAVKSVLERITGGAPKPAAAPAAAAPAGAPAESAESELKSLFIEPARSGLLPFRGAGQARVATEAAAMRTYDAVHLSLLLLAFGAAYLVPFELLLLSYVVLGPAHYFTEISWLHDRKYFLPHRGIALALAALAIVAALIEHASWFGFAMWGALVVCAMLAATRSAAEGTLLFIDRACAGGHHVFERFVAGRHRHSDSRR